MPKIELFIFNICFFQKNDVYWSRRVESARFNDYCHLWNKHFCHNNTTHRGLVARTFKSTFFIMRFFNIPYSLMEREDLSQGELCFLMFLLYKESEFNKEGSWFDLGYSDINLDPHTISKYRQSLKEKGLLDFKNGNFEDGKRNNSSYKINIERFSQAKQEPNTPTPTEKKQEKIIYLKEGESAIKKQKSKEEKKQYKKWLFKTAEKNRKNQTIYEQNVGRWLKKHGIRYRAQVPIMSKGENKGYIADFVIYEKGIRKSIIEVDGQQHYSEDGIESDKERTAELRRKGYTVSRIKNLATTDTKTLDLYMRDIINTLKQSRI